MKKPTPKQAEIIVILSEIDYIIKDLSNLRKEVARIIKEGNKTK